MALELYVRKYVTIEYGGWKESSWHRLYEKGCLSIVEDLLKREDGSEWYTDSLQGTRYFVKIKQDDGRQVGFRVAPNAAVNLDNGLCYETDETLWNLIEENVVFDDCKEHDVKEIVDLLRKA